MNIGNGRPSLGYVILHRSRSLLVREQESVGRFLFKWAQIGRGDQKWKGYVVETLLHESRIYRLPTPSEIIWLK